MAIYQDGAISGRIGNLIFCRRYGKTIVRCLPKKSTKPASVAQLEVRQRFAVIRNFLAPLKSITDRSFPKVGYHTSANRCISYHLKEAAQGHYPNVNINYEAVKISKGNLSKPLNALYKNLKGESLQFSWRTSTHLDTGQIMVFTAYNADRDVWLMREFENVIGENQVDIEVPADWKDETLYAWCTYRDQKIKNFSNSIYLGVLRLVTWL